MVICGDSPLVVFVYTFGLVTSCCVRDGKETAEFRYYISSLPIEAKQFARAVRGHWGIENGCHWSLDMTFREDESRLRERHFARTSPG